jgi:hypothetical protein
MIFFSGIPPIKLIAARVARILLASKERKDKEKSFMTWKNENVMEINQDKAKQTRQTREQLEAKQRYYS